MSSSHNFAWNIALSQVFFTQFVGVDLPPGFSVIGTLAANRLIRLVPFLNIILFISYHFYFLLSFHYYVFIISFLLFLFFRKRFTVLLRLLCLISFQFEFFRILSVSWKFQGSHLFEATRNRSLNIVKTSYNSCDFFTVF